MNTLNGYSKSTLTDNNVLTASGGHIPLEELQANSAKILANYFSARPANCDLLWADGGLRHFLATSTMTTSKPPYDAHVLHFSWDNSKWESQLALSTSSNPRLFIRSLNGTNWSNWITLLGSNNYTDYVYNKLNIDSIITTTQSYIRPSGYVTSGTANLDSYWAKLWEMEGIVAENKDITLYIHSAYLNLRGFIHINVRRNLSTAEDGTITYNWNIHLKQISGNLPKNRFRLYYNNTSGLNNSGKVLLWCNVNLRYGVYNCQLISATPRVGKESLDNYGTLYSTNFGTVQTLPDDSYIELTDANPITDYYWANVKVSDSSSTTTSPTFATAKATTSVTTPLVSSTGRLTLNATSTGVDLKFNGDSTKSVILNGTAFKPFGDANNKLTLGSTSAKWSTIYGYTGDFITKINTPRIDGYNTSGVYLVLKSAPTAVGSLGGAIGIGISPDNYGMFLWGDGSGYGHIQVGRKDGTNTAYLLKLLEFGGNVNIGSPNLSPAKLNVRGSLFLDTGDATLKIYSGKTADAKDDGFIAMLTCIDLLDGETHSYAPNYPNREAILLQPRGGKVAIGTIPQGSAKLTVAGNINITNTAGNVDTGVIVTGSTYSIKFAIGSGNINRGIYDTTNSGWMLYKDDTTTYIPSWINKGNSTTPVYFDSTGKPVACTAYSSASVNSASKLTTARTIAISEGAVGTPTSFNGTANISIPITSVKEAYLTWGGRSLAASLSPVDAATDGQWSTNRLSFMPASGIQVEYSTNGGTSWTDYGLTDAQKQSLVTTGLSQTLYMGNNSASQSVNDMLRVTITAESGKTYFSLKKIYAYLCTNGANSTMVKIEKAMNGSDTTFVVVGEYPVSGWSGWNSIPLVASFGGGDNQTGNIRRIRMTFYFTAYGKDYGPDATNKVKFYITNIQMMGETSWANSGGNLSKTGHLYSWDINKIATFPAKVKASEFIGSLNGNAITATSLSSWLVASSVDTKRYIWMSHSDNSGKACYDVDLTYLTSTDTLFVKNVNAARFITAGGSSSLFVKGDGSLDNTKYASVTSCSKGGNIAYDKFTTPSTTSDGWYTIFTCTDNTNSPCLVNVRAYAHSSMIFIVTKGWSTSGNISIIEYNSSSNNSYAWIKGARILSNGKVQINLYTGSNVDVQISVVSPRSVSLVSTLVCDNTVYSDSTSVTIIDSKLGTNKTMFITDLKVSNNILATSFIKTGGTSTLFLKADGSVDSTLPYNANSERTANYVLAAPNGINGKATFRKLVLADLPNLSDATGDASRAIVIRGGDSKPYGVPGIVVDASSCVLKPNTNNNGTLGNSSYRWNNIYSTSGNFSGNISAGSISTGTIGNLSEYYRINDISIPTDRITGNGLTALQEPLILIFDTIPLTYSLNNQTYNCNDAYLTITVNYTNHNLTRVSFGLCDTDNISSSSNYLWIANEGELGGMLTSNSYKFTISLTKTWKKFVFRYCGATSAYADVSITGKIQLFPKGKVAIMNTNTSNSKYGYVFADPTVGKIEYNTADTYFNVCQGSGLRIISDGISKFTNFTWTNL